MKKMSFKRYESFVNELYSALSEFNVSIHSDFKDRDMIGVSINYIVNKEQDYYFEDYNSKKQLISDIISNVDLDSNKLFFLDDYFNDFCDNLRKESKKYILENIKELNENDIRIWSDYNRNRTYGNLKDLNKIQVFIELDSFKGDNYCKRFFIDSDFNNEDNKNNIMNNYKTHCDKIIRYIRKHLMEEELNDLSIEMEYKDLLESRIKMYLSEEVIEKVENFVKLEVDLSITSSPIILNIKFNDFFNNCIIHDKIELKSEYKKCKDIIFDFASVLRTISNEIDYYIETLNK